MYITIKSKDKKISTIIWKLKKKIKKFNVKRKGKLKKKN